jgi:hypothetical protein
VREFAVRERVKNEDFMGHTHEHADRTSYYLEQLWTIGTCGAIGVVMILLWWYQVLAMFLDPKFHLWVLWGGVTLLFLVAVRIAALWSATKTGETGHQCCQHNHHDSAHNHDHCHELHGHPHEHEEHAHHEDVVEKVPTNLAEASPAAALAEHDHGWAPMRFAVLLVPVVLFLMRIPWPDPPDNPESANIIPMKLEEASKAAEDEQARTDWKNRMQENSVRLKGKAETPFAGDRRFGFVKLRMTCCFADAYGEPVNLIVESPEPLPLEKFKGQWVKVIGKLEFRKMAGADKYVSVVKVKPDTIKLIEPPANQFDN